MDGMYAMYVPWKHLKQMWANNKNHPNSNYAYESMRIFKKYLLKKVKHFTHLFELIT